MEYKSLKLELDAVSHEKGTATIAHAVYNNVDLVDDVARKGMFAKTWNERKGAPMYDISFYLNHDDTKAAGIVTRCHDNETKAFTDIKAGTHTLGRDVLIMMDEGIARKASFGFETIKKNYIKKEKKQLRELLEVDHVETSVLTRLSANPLAGITRVTKQLNPTNIILEMKQLSQTEQVFITNMLRSRQTDLEKLVAFAGGLDVSSDLYTTTQYWISSLNSFVGDMKSQIKYNTKELGLIPEFKEHLENLRKFVRNTKASDEAIQGAELEIKSIEDALDFDTATTPLITEPGVSEPGDTETKDFAEYLSLLSLKHF